MTKCSANYCQRKGNLKLKKTAFSTPKIENCLFLKTKTKCRGRLHMSGDVIIKYVGEHNHAGDASKTPVLIALQVLRERATQEPTQTIIAETTTNIPDSSAEKELYKGRETNIKIALHNLLTFYL